MLKADVGQASACAELQLGRRSNETLFPGEAEASRNLISVPATQQPLSDTHSEAEAPRKLISAPVSLQQLTSGAEAARKLKLALRRGGSCIFQRRSTPWLPLKLALRRGGSRMFQRPNEPRYPLKPAPPWSKQTKGRQS